ncbi:lysophospholipase [Schaalia sp. 19OD2882]|uniref:alpha/beta hydrolase n=1 Tax=Schaalia sp. 19OD2882 TaxID=2794089 RepID=UPI001C1ECC9F|nr:alpha/beta hydrolase [Schaalia sp. 19OD2882]QWW19292.1 lysophospholipase [Schaalia sp. 19OD2882]
MEIQRAFADTDQPKGTVLLSHGFAEHMGRYLPLRRALVESGYDIAFYDHACHGTAPGPRACVDVGRLIRDHVRARREVLTRARSSRLFLFGHSMGGLVTAASTLVDPIGVRGVVLTGPAVAPLPAVPVEVARAMTKAARLTPGVQVRPAVPDPQDSKLSRDPEVQRAFNADPLCHQGGIVMLTASTMVVQAHETMRRANRWRAPLLVFHGNQDELCDLEGSREFVRRAVSAHPGVDVHLRVVDGARHEVLNEPEGPSIMRDMVLWLDAH